MGKNIGSVDRILRLIVGALLLVLPFASGIEMFDTGPMKFGTAIVGLVLVFTALVKFCPLYRIFGIRTCKI